MTDTPPATTTDSGAPAESDEHSLTAGPAGPVLLQDAYLIEQMAQFNRERIPERRPPRKGSGAFGQTGVEALAGGCQRLAHGGAAQPGTETDVLRRPLPLTCGNVAAMKVRRR
ncbi:Catalase [Streptomyces tendae]